MKNKFFVSMIRSAIQRVGFDIVRYKKPGLDFVYPPDFSSDTIQIWELVKPYTMTSAERVNSLINAVQYVVKNGIDGAFVECGVWKGGSSMAMALTLLRLSEKRDLYLYDTYSGMTAPGDNDISFQGVAAHQTFSKNRVSDDTSDWGIAPLEEVRQNLLDTGYDEERIHFIKGNVEETIPRNIPEEIALLRLDTDWYESTKHELVHLFPLLKPNGVLIIDDYGHWQGARKAADEYFSNNNIRILLNRIDYTGRIAIKT